jgi:predicted RNA-binding Zn ribbon-like protein
MSDPIAHKKLPQRRSEERFSLDNPYDSFNWLIGAMLLRFLFFEGGLSMPFTASPVSLLGGRLSVDFVNANRSSADLSWEHLIHFLESTSIVSAGRGAQLLGLPQSDPQAADGLLRKARRLGSALRKVFTAMLRKQRMADEWIEPINEILRITEGHDELVGREGNWKIEFVAREGGLDWLLAAVARSGAEIIAEGARARLRLCANPHCGLFFCDNSRTRRRRWCSMAVCGNRSKVAAFARKHASVRNAP